MLNTMKSWYFLSKMNLDGHYYADRHKSIEDTLPLTLVEVSVPTLNIEQMHILIELCKSFDTLVIGAYQTFSLMNFLHKQQLISAVKDKEILNALDTTFITLFKMVDSSFIEVKNTPFSSNVKSWNYDFRIKNNSPHAFQFNYIQKEFTMHLQLSSIPHHTK